MESRRLSAQNRKQESLDGFWATLTPVQRDGIAAMPLSRCSRRTASRRASPETGRLLGYRLCGKLLRHAQTRLSHIAGPDTGGSDARDLRAHRGVLQSATAALRPRLVPRPRSRRGRKQRGKSSTARVERAPATMLLQSSPYHLPKGAAWLVSHCAIFSPARPRRAKARPSRARPFRGRAFREHRISRSVLPPFSPAAFARKEPRQPPRPFPLRVERAHLE
jgi:hypothetical protein